MNKAVQSGLPYTNSLTLALLGGFICKLAQGRENSVVLRQHGRSQPRWVGNHFGDDFSSSCANAVAFAKQILTGQLEEASPEHFALAKRALVSCEIRKNDETEAWVEQLVRDVGNAID